MMWLYVMFDLPVGTKKERKLATKFRKALLDQGFEMAQFSVYLRFAESKEAAETHVNKIRRELSSKGNIHIVTITDREYANAFVFSGRKEGKKRSEKPMQLQLF